MQVVDHVFENEPIILEGIPRAATLEYSPLEPAYLKSSLIFTVLFFLILMVAATVVRFVFTPDWIIPLYFYVLGGLLVLGSLFCWLTIKAFKKKHYALREKDILYQSGLVWHDTVVVPFNRVQHCEVGVGPIDRMFGLAELKIFTAGGSSSDLTIEGLTAENARRLKDFIISKTAFADEEE